MYTHTRPALGGQKRVCDSQEPESIDSCETQCGCWKLNPELLQEQQILLLTHHSEYIIQYYVTDQIKSMTTL